MLKKNIILAISIIVSQVLPAQSIINGGFDSGNTEGWKFTNPSSGYSINVEKEAGTENAAVKIFSSGGNSWSQLGQRIAFISPDSISRQQLSARIKFVGAG